MRPRRFLAVIAAVALSLVAEARERGLPLITVYPAEVHRAGPQTFEVAQGADGVLYFGNLGGLLTYDGASWKMMKLPDDQAPLSLATDPSGRVVLGLVDDIGHLVADAKKSHRYESLLPLIPPEKRSFGDVRGICSTPDGFLIAAQRRTFFWNGRAMHVVAEHTPETMPRGCYTDGVEIAVYGRGGVSRFDGRTRALRPTAITRQTDAVVRMADGATIAAVRDEGLFIADTGKPYAPAASAWLRGKIAMDALRLEDGRLAITTYSHGLLILGRRGEIEQIIDDAAGLPAAVLNSVFVDRESSLWLTMDGPIVRIDLASPVSLFDTRSGLKGAASDAERHDGRLYVASSHGLYTIDAEGRARRLEGIREGAWRLEVIDGEMLVATARAIYRVRGESAPELVATTDSQVYALSQSAGDPSRVWVAMRTGLGTLRKERGTWRFEAMPTGHEYIGSVVEHNGILWCGTVFDGVLRIENPGTKEMRLRQFGDGEMNVFVIGGRLVIVKATGNMLTVSPEGRLAPDPLLGHVEVPGGYFVIAEDRRGNVWLNSTPPRLVRRLADGNYARETQPLVSVTATDIQGMRATDDNVLFFASDKGLFRYIPSSSPDLAPQPRPLIRRVVAGEERLLFGGAAVPSATVSLAHDFRRVRIEYAPASYRPGVVFQYRLDPIDTQWSRWTGETFVDFTTLEANDYVFRLRARGAATLPSPEVRWSFSVLSPWYRTRWAWALWIAIAAALLVLVFRIRTQTLRRQAEQLRARVAEQTGRLQQTVELLEQANARLEMLSMADDLTGIANRRYFQRALTDEWNRARRHGHPVSLILIDLDHFKELNDRRGHPAGDESLRRVGNRLAEMIRRSGEVVARYGGEEFAVLLPNVDVESATRVAETIRRAIADLRIDYGGERERVMTTSCGVSSLVPVDDLTPEDLIEQADRALYAAKHAGRNCVRIWSAGILAGAVS